MKNCALLVAATIFISASALASRTIAIPPLTQETAHGGLMNTTGTNYATCVTADMTGPSSYGNGEGGVVSVNQRYKIAFQNLSSTNQNVTINIMPGTKMSGSHSRGNGASIPDTANTPRSIDGSPYSWGFTLTPAGSPGSSSQQEVNFTSNNTTSNISPPDPGVTCTGAPQICLYQQSTLILSFTVAEDRGAVLANITSSSHRCSGYIDHYIQPPLGFQVNGGRPF